MPYHRIDDPEKLRLLLEAVLQLESDISLPAILRHFVEEACVLTGARYGALGVLDESRTALGSFVFTGLPEEAERTIGHLPTGQGVLGVVIAELKPLRLTRIADHPRSVGFPAGHPPMTSFLGVPVGAHGDVFGILYLADKLGSDEFSQDDEWLAHAFAQAAAVAVENARLHERVQEVAVLEDRDRIARDLHDDVIQRLFATGLTLQSLTREIPASESQRLEEAVSEIDATIRRIRSAIFELAATGGGRSVRAGVLSLVHELRPMLGFEPAVSFAGPVDTVVPPDISEHLYAAVREALTNVARHARATSASVEIEALGGTCTLTVVDDGQGMQDAPRAAVAPGAGGFGIANLRRRAEKLGGELDVRQGARGGTRLTMRVPLPT